MARPNSRFKHPRNAFICNDDELTEILEWCDNTATLDRFRYYYQYWGVGKWKLTVTFTSLKHAAAFELRYG